MKKFTQKQFDKIPVGENGIRLCPTGDYSSIKVFGGRCAFGERCSFGEWCKADSPFWSFVYPPPFETQGRIYPTEPALQYWAERLNTDMSGCYDDIAKRVTPLLPKILKRTDLTTCERRILESWL